MRTFHFNSLIEAARFCETYGVAKAAISIKARNRAGMATRCEVTAPAGVYA